MALVAERRAPQVAVTAVAVDDNDDDYEDDDDTTKRSTLKRKSESNPTMIDEQVVLFGGATSRKFQFEGFCAAIRSAFPGAQVHVFCPKETCDHEWWVGVPNLTGQPGPA